MSFDKETRNLLARTVTACRRRLLEDVTDQLRGDFGLHPDGTVLPLDKLTHLSPDQTVAARRLRDLLDHYSAGAEGKDQERRKAAHERMTLEMAFTILNRLAALRLCEERGLVVECVRKGTASDGFQMFERISGGALGGRYDAYRVFLECMFDELALDLGVLFDRLTPQSAVFPTERSMEDVLAELNKLELTHLWTEDETIGWVYQYFNPPEERKAMREASQAPRNSRELAVRNQFFTPRYVVEFLTDNTLGRIWYEMRKGGTALKEECRYLVRQPNEVFLTPREEAPAEPDNEMDVSREEILKKTVYIEHRPKKDPRDLRVLDPACGSGHFLLCAFDLLEQIYQEAWADSESPRSEITGETLRHEFETLEGLRRVAPKLIIEHNLHGIDIDPRAVQIAALALWLRAQKTWKQLGIRAVERPRIARSNIVTAEPMPGEDDMRREFTTGLKPRVLGQLVDEVFEKMKLAGEAGSLLKIEEEIEDVVADARKQWMEGPEPERQLLFPGIVDALPKQQELRFDVKGISDERFWQQAEDRILDALKDYAERVEDGGVVRRRLFAQDAVRGFAFVDLCRKRYDVVLMNPPFGEPASGAREYQESSYERTKNDVYAASIERAVGVLNRRGGLGAITSRTGFFLKRFQPWREEIMLREVGPLAVVDLGPRVLDSAAVETACYSSMKGYAGTALFIKADEAEDKIPLIENAIQELRRGKEVPFSYYLQPSSFLHLPESKWLYWLPKGVRNAFVTLKSYKKSGFLACAGLQTNDDFRFVRASWEVPRDRIGSDWANFYKGGEYSPYYDDIHLCVNWRSDGYEIKQHTISLGNSPSRHVVNEERYFSPGYAYINISSVGFSPQVFPRGVVFSIQGQFIGGEKTLPSFALLSSSAVAVFLDIINPGRHYQAGQVQLLPMPQAQPEEDVERKASELVDLKREQCGWVEDTRLFNAPIRFDRGALVRDMGAKTWEKLATQRSKITELQTDIDAAAYSAYQLDDDSIRYVSQEVAESRKHPGFVAISSLCDHLVSQRELTIWIASSILSYAVGDAVGRWDVRIALDPSLAPRLPDPFGPLPVCPPGMLVGPDGLPAESSHIVSEEWLRARPEATRLPSEGSVSAPTISDASYPVRVSWDGILADDPGFNENQPHRDDIVRRVREVFDLLWKDRAQEIEQEACEILGVSDLRDYFRKPTGFFEDHLKRYSKSRRKAPIYWPLSTASGSYTIWLYYHRLTDQTIYAAVNKYVGPKITEAERGVARIEDDLKTASGRQASQLRDRLNEARAFLGELRDFREELLRIAALPYKPNLNDGVIINAAPFHKLFRLRSWAKDTEECWKSLSKGEYDWAHLAYTIWPDRVREICKTDRSIAIAHGLEDLCEVKAPTAKKTARRRKQQ